MPQDLTAILHLQPNYCKQTHDLFLFLQHLPFKIFYPFLSDCIVGEPQHFSSED